MLHIMDNFSCLCKYLKFFVHNIVIMNLSEGVGFITGNRILNCKNGKLLLKK
jgi:hypothetical protein